MSDPIETLSFEEALRELEETVTQLEEGELTLEASLALFERGQKLAEFCNVTLDKATLRVQALTEDGEIVDVEIG